MCWQLAHYWHFICKKAIANIRWRKVQCGILGNEIDTQVNCKTCPKPARVHEFFGVLVGFDCFVEGSWSFKKCLNFDGLSEQLEFLFAERREINNVSYEWPILEQFMGECCSIFPCSDRPWKLRHIFMMKSLQKNLHKTNQKDHKTHANQLISGKFCSAPVDR